MFHQCIIISLTFSNCWTFHFLLSSPTTTSAAMNIKLTPLFLLGDKLPDVNFAPRIQTLSMATGTTSTVLLLLLFLPQLFLTPGLYRAMTLLPRGERKKAKGPWEVGPLVWQKFTRWRVVILPLLSILWLNTGMPGCLQMWGKEESNPQCSNPPGLALRPNCSQRLREVEELVHGQTRGHRI